MATSCVFKEPLGSLLRLSGVSLAAKIRQKEVSVEEVTRAFIKRIQDVNKKLNAVAEERFEHAVQEAKEIDEMIQVLTEEQRDDLAKIKPFLGVPFTAKESFAITGMPNCSGLVSRKDFVASEDAAVILRLRQAGALAIAVSNCSELCMWWESANRVYGRTCNPFDTSKIVGGSSGGEGALLGAGASVFGVGSDIGGSIRMPAFFNGIFGHKPSPDIVPNTGQFPCATGKQSLFLCTGPMCRYAEDLKPLLKVMSGEKATTLKLDEPVDIKQVRIFSIIDGIGNFLVSNIDSELLEAQTHICEQIEKEYGTKVEYIKLDKLAHSLEIWSTMMSTSAQKSFCHYMGNEITPVNPLWELLKACVGWSAHTLPAIGLGIIEKLEMFLPKSMIKPYLTMAEELQDELQTLLGDYGVLIYPSHPTTAPSHNRPLLMPFNFALTGIFNVLYMPVTQCPVGLSKAGLPLGIQIVAARNNDHLTLAMAEHIEKLCGGWDKLCTKKYAQTLLEQKRQ